MLTAMVEKAIKKTAGEGEAYRHLFLTGGDGLLLSRHIQVPDMELKLVPALVLDGLAIALP